MNQSAINRLPSIQTRLILSVNGVLLVFVVLFLYLDYRSTLKSRIAEKQLSLQEEAKSILPAILHLRHHGNESIQKYIDDVCQKMKNNESPFHHIGIKLDAFFLQSHNHDHHLNDFRFDEIIDQPGRSQIVESNGKMFTIGIQTEPGISVFVLEEISQIRKDALFMMGRQFVAILVLGILAALVVNMLMSRLVNKPIKRLVEQVRSIGQGDFENSIEVSRSLEFAFLANEVNKMSEGLKAAERQKNASLERAKRIQRNLLPKDLDSLDGLSIAQFFCPAEEVGGDFYDVKSCGEKKWFLCVVDSAGHGVPAAMSAAMIKSLLFKPEEILAEPAKTLKEINKQYMQIHPLGEFATVFIAYLNLNEKTLVYANAGHGNAILFPSESADAIELQATGTPLGINENGEWTSQTIPIAAKSRLVVATDGIPETFGQDDELYGNSRFVEQLNRSRNSSGEELVANVIESATKFRGANKQHDDMTLLVVDTSIPE